MDLNVLVNTNYREYFTAHPLDVLQIHNTGFFFPWHRLFVQTFEDELKAKCGYDGAHPYWDWTQGNIPHREHRISILT